MSGSEEFIYVDMLYLKDLPLGVGSHVSMCYMCVLKVMRSQALS